MLLCSEQTANVIWTLGSPAHYPQIADRGTDSPRVNGRDGPSKSNIPKLITGISFDSGDYQGFIEHSQDDALNQHSTASPFRSTSAKRKRRTFTDQEKKRMKELKEVGGCPKCAPKHRKVSLSHV